jgi:hypothetical protein
MMRTKFYLVCFYDYQNQTALEFYTSDYNFDSYHEIKEDLEKKHNCVVTWSILLPSYIGLESISFS